MQLVLTLSQFGMYLMRKSSPSISHPPYPYLFPTTFTSLFMDSKQPPDVDRLGNW